MKQMTDRMNQWLYRLQAGVKGPLHNERGAEIAEVGIWLALIVAVSIALITTLGGDIMNAFTSITSNMP